MTQLTFDFSKPVHANLISALIELHDQLNYCASQLHLPYRLHCFKNIKFSAMKLRHYLFEHDILSIAEYDLMKKQYDLLVDKYESFISLYPEAIQ